MISLSAEIDEYPSLHFQDIRRKKNKVSWTDMDGWMDRCENSIPTTNKVCRGGGCVCGEGGGAQDITREYYFPGFIRSAKIKVLFSFNEFAILHIAFLGRQKK